MNSCGNKIRALLAAVLLVALTSCATIAARDQVATDAFVDLFAAAPDQWVFKEDGSTLVKWQIALVKNGNGDVFGLSCSTGGDTRLIEITVFNFKEPVTVNNEQVEWSFDGGQPVRLEMQNRNGVLVTEGQGGVYANFRYRAALAQGAIAIKGANLDTEFVADRRTITRLGCLH